MADSSDAATGGVASDTADSSADAEKETAVAPADGAEAPEGPADPIRTEHLAELTELLGDSLLASHITPGENLYIRVPLAAWRDVAQALRDSGLTYFGFLSAIDWADAPEGRYEDTEFDAGLDENEGDTGGDDTAPADTTTSSASTGTAAGHTGGDTRFQVLLQLHDVRRHLSLLVKADVPPADQAADTFATAVGTADGASDTDAATGGVASDTDAATGGVASDTDAATGGVASDTATTQPVPTISDLFAGANWHERETHEMFGIHFTDHPNLAPIYLPTEFEGHPLRKDFPLLARAVKPWPGVVDIEDIPEELEEELEAEVMARFEADLAAGKVQ